MYCEQLKVILSLQKELRPYLNEEWQESVVQPTKGKAFETLARYRYYDNVIEIKEPSGKKVFALGLEYTEYIKIGSGHFKVFRYEDKQGIARIGLFELFAEGSLSLLAKYEKQITDAVNNGYRNTQASVEPKRQFFIYDQLKDSMIRLKNFGKKSLLPVFGKHAKNMESAVKKNKWSFKKKADLIQIIEYYNSTYSTAK